MSPRAPYTQRAPRIIKIMSFEWSRGSLEGELFSPYIYIYTCIELLLIPLKEDTAPPEAQLVGTKSYLVAAGNLLGDDIFQLKVGSVPLFLKTAQKHVCVIIQVVGFYIQGFV